MAESNIGKRRREAKSEGRSSYLKRRTEILAAAAGVFREQGYYATSMTDLAQVLGVDRATLYYYTGSKDELFQEVTGSALQINAKLADEIANSEGTPAERLERLIRALMLSYESYYPYLFIYIQENINVDGNHSSAWESEMSHYAHRFARAMARIIHQGVADGSFGGITDVGVATNSILGMLNWSHRWFKPNEGPSAEEVGSVMSSIALHGILAGKPGAN